MAAARTAWLALGTGALLLAGGCQSVGNCKHPLSDTTAQQIPPLKMPDGLDGPDTHQALQIPPLTQPEAPRGKDDSCLQNPPAMREAGSQTPPATKEAEEDANAAPKPRRPVSPPH